MRELHGWRRVVRWINVFIAGTLGLLVVVIAGAVVVFHTSWGREQLRHQIESRMNAVFTGGAKVGAVEGDVLSELVLRDLVINGPDGKPAISMGKLKIELPLLPLISHQLRVDKLIAEDLDVALRRDVNGELQIKHLMKPGPASTWNVAMPNLEIHRGHVAIDDVNVDAIEMFATVKIPFAGPVDASVTVRANWRERAAEIAVGAVVKIDTKQIAVPSAVVEVGAVKLALAGIRIPKGNVQAFSGTLAAYAPAAGVTALMPGLELPSDVAISVDATPVGPWTDLAIASAAFGGVVRGFGRVDFRAKTAHGFVAGSGLDLGALTRGKVDGTGGLVAAFDLAAGKAGALPTAHGMVASWGDLRDTPHIDALIAFDTVGDLARAAIAVSSPSGVRAGIGAVVRHDAKTTTLERADVIAVTSDPARASGGKTSLHGAFSANLTARGRLAPELELAVAGHVDGKRLRINDVSASSLALRIDAAHLPSHPVGSARVEIDDLVRRDVQFGKLTVAAGNRPDGKLQVSFRSAPKQAPWLVDADLLVTTGQTVIVDIQRHVVRANNGAEWRGTTGRLAIGPQKIELRNFKSSSADGMIDATASYLRRSGDLTAQLDTSLDLSAFGNGYHGRVAAKLDVERVAGRLGGTVDVKATGVTTAQRPKLSLDGEARLDAHHGKITGVVSANSAHVGAAKLALDIDGPQDLANFAGWRKLDRAAIRTLELTVQSLDLAKASELAGLAPMVGHVDGDLKLAPDAAGGSLHVRKLRVGGRGDIDADLVITQAGPGEIRTELTAAIDKVGRGSLDATVATPAKIFDPTAWKQLDGRSLRGAHLRVAELSFEPGTLEKLGIDSNMRGKVSASADIDDAVRGARLVVDFRELRGGVLAQPIAAHIAAEIDGKSSHGDLTVRANKVTLLQLTVALPRTIEQLRADPKGARTAPLSATITIPSVPAKVLMPVLGTGQVTGGVLDGKIELGGTLAKPTLKANLVARDVTVPSETTKPTQVVRQLTLDATWDGGAGNVAIHGDENGGGKLDLKAAGRADAPGDVTGSFVASNIDIAPLVAFLPGPAGGLGGKLDAKLDVKGVDPRTGEITGTLRITEGRLPIAPAIGTLFHGDVHLDIKDKKVSLDLAGKVGGGSVKLVANVPLDGVSPTGGHADLTVHGVQLIGTTQPKVDATITANLARVDTTWRAQIKVQRATVEIPEEKGEKLKPVGPPNDVIFRRLQKPKVTKVSAGPVAPVMVADLDLGSTLVESKEIHGVATGKLTATMGPDGTSIIGDVSLDRADLDLFDRRYTVERAVLHFDGSADPVLDIRITHDFPDVTTVTEIYGRMSKPQLRLTSEPGTYSYEQLLGFLLGGEPNGDPNNSPSTARRVSDIGASFVANKISGYVKKVLPIDIDVLRYESATSMNSAAVTVGTWITHSLFLAYREHLESRPDENAGEGEVEYWLQRRLVLEGVVGDRGYDGADLLWRRRW